jgi:hypothetical protein
MQWHCSPGPGLGLHINAGKCEIVSHPSSAGSARELQRRLREELHLQIPDDKLLLEGNYSLLGAPIGTAPFCADFVRDHALVPALESLRAACKIMDPQIGHTLLRRCAGFGQLVHAIRTTPPSRDMEMLCTTFDKDMLQAVVGFIGPVSSSCHPQIRRSTKTGGLGFRAAHEHMRAAYIGSVATCAKLDDWSPETADGFVDATLHLALATSLTVADIMAHSSQRTLSEAVCASSFAAEQLKDTHAAHARKVSQAGEGASKWLTVIPSKEYGQAFTPKEYRVLVRWWLGEDVYVDAAPCRACGGANDLKGYHALTCQCWGGRIHRHHSISNECARILAKAHHNPSREHSLDGRTRPADVYIPHWTAGRPLALDFAVTHPLQPQSFDMAGVRVPGSWAEAYASTHKAKYIEPCMARGVDFQAMVVETYGSWDPAALTILNEIANQYAMHQGIDAPVAADRLLGRLSVTLMRLNARMMLVRGDVGDAFEDDVPTDGALEDYPFLDEGPDSNQDFQEADEECRF